MSDCLSLTKRKKVSISYVLSPDLYSSLDQDKVIKEAASRSGVMEGVMQACWNAAGEVIKAWATEGHSVAIPGLGTMRFGLRAKAVENVNDVKAGLIITRRIIFTPTVKLKDELANTAIQITCIDRNGKEVKRVTSSDSGDVEEDDGEHQSSENSQPSTGGNTGGNGNNTGGNQGGNTGGGSDNHEPIGD